MRRQHTLDLRHTGHLHRTLCGRDMPDPRAQGDQSCEQCARVARARAERDLVARAR